MVFRTAVGLQAFQVCKVEPVAKLRHGNWNEDLAHFELSAVFSSSAASTYGTCQSRLEAIRRLAHRASVWVPQHTSRSDVLHKNCLSPKVSAVFSPCL